MTIPPRLRLLSGLLIVGGMLAVLVGLLADRGGGIGMLQAASIGLGLAAITGGMALSTPAGRARWTGWRERLRVEDEPAQLVVIAAFFALVAGWGQVAVQFIRRNLLHEVIGMGLDYAWMLPIAVMGIFLLVAAALLPLRRKWPHRFARPTIVAIFAFLASLSLLLLVRHIHKAALVFLALGIAVQFARVVKRRPGFDALARFSVGWPALLRQPPPVAGVSALPSRRDFVVGASAAIVVAAVGVRARETYRERRASPATSSGPAQPPNVLLIVLDTVRAASLSLFGYQKETTPGLARLSRQGIHFTRAIAPAPWTLPSHASMFTGRWPHELTVGPWSPLDATYPTLAEYLRDRGYHTAGFVANREYCSHEFGLSRGFAHYEDYRATPGQAVLYTTLGNTAMQEFQAVQALRNYRNFGRKSAEQLTEDFLSWHGRVAARGPFFAFLNYWDAHDPYDPPRSFARQFAGIGTRGGTPPTDPPEPERLAALQGHYDAAIAYADAQISHLVDALAARGALEDTVVLIASDHGEHFGEHGLMLHGGSLYSQELHVPLIVLHPRLASAGQSVSTPVTLRSVAASVTDLVGLGATSPFPGDSLLRAWADGRVNDPILSEADRVQHLTERYPAAQGRLASLVRQNLHYIRREADGGEELYDLDADPAESHDLAGDASYQAAVEEIRAGLSAALAS